MEQLVWRKSRRSGNQNACVELACVPDRRLVRDSKNPTGPRLAFTASAVSRLLADVRNV
jgi:hypothetical protein